MREPQIALWREHKFVGGPPPKRLYRMQIAHEVRARKLGIKWEPVDLRRVFAKCHGLCGVCLLPVSLDEFTIDHIVALSNGGTHTFGNLQIAHRSCNAHKGNR